jgi:signal peptidase I
MEEIVYTQRFDYADITIYSDTCDIQDKVKYVNKRKNEDLFDFNVELENSDIVRINIPTEDNPRTKNRTLFKIKKGEQGDLMFKKERSFHTINDGEIRTHYANPNASITVYNIERVVKRKGDKVILKYYRQVKERRFNSKYFKKYSENTIMSFNLKNGDITLGEISRNGRNKTMRFRKNSFFQVSHAISNSKLFHLTSKRNTLIHTSSDVFPAYIVEMGDSSFINTFLSEIGSELGGRGFSLSDNNDREILYTELLRLFISRKLIKSPNDYRTLLERYYPTEKFLKKNDRKLVVSILDSFGINTKSMVRLLHDYPKINVVNLSILCSFFGDEYSKYLSVIPHERIINIVSNTHDSTVPAVDKRKRTPYDLSNHEKECLISILMDDITKTDRVNSIISLIIDHINMMEKVRVYLPETRINARTYRDFHTEHMEFSKIVSQINKGWSIEYVYDNRVIRKIESPIQYEHDGVEYEFRPYILKRDEEYEEEGKFMHHCVATYANKESSMIVSVRLNNGEDRVTCEYDKKSGVTIQERHFTNKMPPPHFNNALKIVSERIQIFHRQRLLNHITTKKVRVKINGIEVTSNRNEVDDIFGLLMDDVRNRRAADMNPF